VDEYFLILEETDDGDGPGVGFAVTTMTVDDPVADWLLCGNVN
jgi:hypothetical protein